MMKCPNKNCNADNPQGSKFCNQCGTKLEMPKKCPYSDCGTDNLPAMAKFCPDCGRPLDKVVPSQEPVVDAQAASSCKIPSDMILVEGGRFTMGGGGSDEKPHHEVTLNSFYMGKYPVTQKQWVGVMGTNPSHFKGDDLPVENVSWYDAIKFCNALSRKEGFDECYCIAGTSVTLLPGKRGYRIPTEAEWEFAAGGGKKGQEFRYAGSNTLSEVAWYAKNSGGQTHSVGKKKPNGLGLYDMSGNVWEWCWDWYGVYPSSSQTNPLGPTTGSYRVSRGASWVSCADRCRSSDRYSNSCPDYRSNGLGFRLVFISPV